MAAQVKKSGLAGMLGTTTSVKLQELAKQTTLPSEGFIQLPPGIRNGVLRLMKIGFDTYKEGNGELAGKPRFFAQGEVMEPITHPMVNPSTGEIEAVKVQGINSWQFVPVCETKVKEGPNAGKITTMEEHLNDVLERLRGYGASTAHIKTYADIDNICEAMTKATNTKGKEIYIRFSTSPRKAMKDDAAQGIKKGDTTGAWENWHLRVEDYVPPDMTAQLQQDDTASSPENNEGVDETVDTAAPGEENFTADSDAGTNQWAESDDTDALLEAANNDDTDAQSRLVELAEAGSGRSAEELDQLTQSWDDYVTFAQGGLPEGVKPSEPEEFVPEKGGKYKYVPPIKDAKSGKWKAGTVAVDCECTAVNGTEKKCDLKNTAKGSKAVYKGVPWTSVVAE